MGRRIRIVWAICLLLAGLNHARILVRYGLFWDYGGAAPASAAYWTLLTLVDPLVALLLFVRARAGVIATILLIATNVAHNLVVTALHAPAGGFLARVIAGPELLCQIGFLLFVLATARRAWPRATAPCAGAS